VPIQHNRDDSQRAVLDIRILKGEKPADLLMQAPTNMSWSSVARRQKYSASKCHPRCSPALMRWSN